MKGIIYQHLSDTENSSDKKIDLFKNCTKTVKRYARNINYDYICDQKKYFKDWDACWQRFRIFYDKAFIEYDYIAYIDADVFCTNTNLDIISKYNGFSASKHQHTVNSVNRPEYKAYGKDFFCSGVFFINNDMLKKLKENVKFNEYMDKFKHIKPGRDQLALNKIMYDYFNGYNEIDVYDATFLRTSTAEVAPIVHLAGRNRNLYFKDKEYWDNHFEVDNA